MLSALWKTCQNWRKSMAGYDEKAALDSQFSLVSTMSIKQLEELILGYQAEKTRRIAALHDVTDKLEFLYELVRLRTF